MCLFCTKTLLHGSNCIMRLQQQAFFVLVGAAWLIRLLKNNEYWLQAKLINPPTHHPEKENEIHALLVNPAGKL